VTVRPRQHRHRDLFVYQPTGQNAGPLSGTTIENLDGVGDATYTRVPPAR
jgi:hypothetical protein